MTEMPLIEVKDLWFSYLPEQWILEGVNLQISKGEFVAIIGQNGAGKTTLVKHFNGINKPVRGEVNVFQRSVQGIPFKEIATQVGYVYQNPDHQIFNTTVREEIAFGPRHLGIPKEQVEPRIKEVLETVGLDGLEQEYPFALGRGQRQKLAVGSILAMNPPILIIDEPTTGLDWQGGMAMMNLIRDLHDQGHTIIMITHDMRIVSLYSQRVIVMSQGRILLDGTPKEVFVEDDILHQAFLQPTQINRVCKRLAKYGMSRDILTVDDAVEQYTKLVRKGK